MRELDADLGDMCNMVCEIEMQVSDREAEIIKKEDHIALLEDRFTRATTKSI